MPQCAILNCNNTHRKTRGGSVRYHRFPGDPCTRSLWIKACGRQVNNCATARVCSRHFADSSYERDVQHELLGLPVRCRLKKGVLPELNLPFDASVFDESALYEDSSIAVLLAVGLIPTRVDFVDRIGGFPGHLNKMHIMEDVREAPEIKDTQPSTPEQDEEHPSATIDETSNSSQQNDGDMPSNGINDDVKPNVDDIKLEEDCNSSNHSGEKRKIEGDGEGVSSKKRLRTDMEQNFILRDKILNEYIDNSGCSSVQQVEYHMDQVLSEIKMLNELAREKEKEWNNIIHLKKIKEELLLRIQRRKQVMLLSSEYDNSLEPQPDILKNIKTSNGLVIFSTNQAKKSTNKSHLNTYMELTNGYGNSKLNPPQRPILDVQSIIADYRQRHPEAVPRRGRRIRSLLNLQGSGAQVKHNMNTEGNGEMSVLLSRSDHQEHQDMPHPSGKPPPPYSEVTVHPVIPMSTQSSNSSLLHGILTKTHSKTENSKSSYSPTLARLLTAPERSVTDSSQAHAASTSLSISDMLSNNKARNEITITPVGGQFDLTVKEKGNNDEEGEEASDRLVIDESDVIDTHNSLEDLVDEVPQCQGCNQKAAQFVCAGCGNQWYCSRECQVVAWDEHSEVCSG